MGSKCGNALRETVGVAGLPWMGIFGCGGLGRKAALCGLTSVQPDGDSDWLSQLTVKLWPVSSLRKPLWGELQGNSLRGHFTHACLGSNVEPHPASSNLQSLTTDKWGSWRDWLMPVVLHFPSAACKLEAWSSWRKRCPSPLGMKIESWGPRAFPATMLANTVLCGAPIAYRELGMVLCLCDLGSLQHQGAGGVSSWSA